MPEPFQHHKNHIPYGTYVSNDTVCYHAVEQKNVWELTEDFGLDGGGWLRQRAPTISLPCWQLEVPLPEESFTCFVVCLHHPNWRLPQLLLCTPSVITDPHLTRGCSFPFQAIIPTAGFYYFEQYILSTHHVDN